MRKDQLYNVGGFDPTHPSGNVLDEFVHDDEHDPTKGVVVRHYDTKGRTLTNRKLTKKELAVFFPADGSEHAELAEAMELRDEFVARRIA